jgi:hypothetical protein
MKIIIAKIAQQEFIESKTYYEIEQSGIGLRFENEIKKALIRIQQFPYTWPIETKEIRRCFLHKFPFKILYSIQSGTIIVLAFAHFHRKPFYWINRLSNKSTKRIKD